MIRKTAGSPPAFTAHPRMGAATITVSGPAAAISASRFRSRTASAQAIHVSVPAAPPAKTLVASNARNDGARAPAMFPTTPSNAAPSRTLPPGRKMRPARKLVTANDPTWTADRIPAVPSETAKRSATSDRMNGVEANNVATATAAAMRLGGALDLSA